MNKNWLLIGLFAVIFTAFASNEVSAFSYTLNMTPTAAGFPINYIDYGANVQVNLTINTSGDLANTTSIKIHLNAADFSAGNKTDNGNAFFSNTTNDGGGPSFPILNWSFGTSGFPNASLYSFVFNMTPNSVQTNALAIYVSNDSSSHAIMPSPSVIVNLKLAGHVKNDSGYVNDTNVTIYQFVTNAGGPPTETYVSSVMSNHSGMFLFSSLNGSLFSDGSNMFRLKLMQCSGADGACTGANAIKTGPILSPMPGLMYAVQNQPGVKEFMRPPTMNGTTFNLQPALTINITATNGTTRQKFGYEIMDLASGFPIGSVMSGNESQYLVVVPNDRTYNVMVARNPWNGVSGFLIGADCDGSFMNDTLCPAPPRSNSTLWEAGTTPTEGSVIDVQFNLTIARAYISGCINVSGNTTAINVTQIYPKLIPYAGFIPPISGDTGDLNLSNTEQLNMSDARCNSFGQIAWYNISLMNADYLLEFFGSNSTPGSMILSGSPMGWVQNFSLTGGNVNLNITLKPMFGSYGSGYESGLGSINTSKIKFNILNASGTGAPTTTPHIELVVYYPHTGKLRYVLEESSSTFYFPVVNTTGVWTKANIYPQGPPVEKKLNLTKTEINITVDDSNGFGFRKVLSNGSFEDLNVSSVPVQMRFIKNSVACNTLTPASSCVIANMSAEDFNPMKVMVAGKVNLEMKMTQSNVTITFVNFDMFSAKPPTNSMFDDTATSSGGKDFWKFGSFAPKDAYDYVLVSVPYNASLDDSKRMNVSIGTLYDEDNVAVWNKSAGDTQSNLPTEYTEKTSSYGSAGFSDFLDTGGQECNKTSNEANMTSFYCHVNTTTDLVYMRLPHFSTVSPSVGTATATVALATSEATTTLTSTTGGTPLAELPVSHFFGEMKAGEVQEMAVDRPGFAVSNIAIVTSNDVTGVRVEAKRLASQPSGTSDLEQDAYQFFEIKSAQLVGKIKEATIKFEVNKSWLSGYDESSVKLARFSNKWDMLPTLKVGSTDTVDVFEAVSQGFSYFAIVAEEKAAAEEEGAPEEQKPAEEAEEAVAAEETAGEKNYAWVYWLIGVIVALAAIAGIVLFVMKRRD